MLDFIDASHTYLLDGQEIPGITAIMRLAGIDDAMEEALFEARTPEDVRAKGRLMHRGIQYDIEGDPYLEADLEPAIAAKIRAARLARQELGLTDPRAEVLVAHTVYRYATKIDLVARRKDPALGDHLVVVNWKPRTRYPHYGIQMAAEEMALRSHMVANQDAGAAMRIERYGIHLDAETKKGYRIERYEDRGDAAVWNAALTIMAWKRRSGQCPF